MRGTPGERSPLVTLAVALATVSALVWAIGIIRWLTASTALAAVRDGGTDAAAVDAAQLAVNAWGGATVENAIGA